MMLSEISEAILKEFENAGINTRQIDYKEITDRQIGSLQRPAVNIAISTGNWVKVTTDKSKLKLNITLLLLVQELRTEKERKFVIYDLMEAIASALFIISMDLELQDLIRPSSFTDVTDTKYNDAGYRLMQMSFTCSYNFEQKKEDLGILRSIVNSYIKDGEITGEEYPLELASIYGGNAYIGDQLPEIGGGSAGTTYWTEEIWGGNSRSTFTK